MKNNEVILYLTIQERKYRLIAEIKFLIAESILGSK